MVGRPAVLVALVAPAGLAELVAPVVTAAVEFAASAVLYQEWVAPAVPAVPAVQVGRMVQNAALMVPVVLVAGVDRMRVATAALVSIPVKARPIAKRVWRRHSRSPLADSMKFLPMNNVRYPRSEGIQKALAVVKVEVPAVAGWALVHKVAAAKAQAVALVAVEQAVLQVRPMRNRPQSVV